MKKRLFIVLMIMIMPVFVKAKDYSLYQLFSDSDYSVVHSGDTISTDPYATYYFYVEGVKENQCFGKGEACREAYTATKDIIVANIAHEDGVYNCYCYEYNDSHRFVNFSEMEQNHLYKSGDIIRYDNSGVSSYYYDANNQSIDEVYDRAAEMLPKYQGKDVFWQVDIFEDGVYDWPAPHFKLYTYVEPKFSLTCQDKTIDYGQKTKCFVSVIAKEELQTISYDLNIPNFKISDVEYPGHIKSIDGDREYNLRVVENKNLDTGMELMSFYLTGTKNESYTDDIKITSIFYRDAVYEGKYEVLRADLEIVPHRVNNPKTVSNLILILFPILICACSYFLILFEQKKLKVNN